MTARLADVLIEDMGERKKAQAKTTTDYLEAEKKRADDDLAKREMELRSVHHVAPRVRDREQRRARRLRGPRREIKRIANPGIMAIERQQQRLRAAAVAAKDAPAAGGGAAAGGAAGPGPDAALPNQKAAADNKLAAAQKDLADKSEKLTDNHPDVKASEVPRERRAGEGA